MTIRVEEIRGPAFLASALVNGDVSGLDEEREDFELLAEFLRYVSPGYVVSTTDDPDTHFATIWILGRRFTGDVVTYVVHYLE